MGKSPLFSFVNGAAVLLLLLISLDVSGFLPTISKQNAAQEKERQNGYGLNYIDKNASFPGYTLVTPLRGNTVYLLDWEGKEKHRWRIKDLPSVEELMGKYSSQPMGLLQAKLLPGGNLLAGYTPSPGALRIGGATTVIAELDRGGREVWRYENPMAHHDFTRLPDGRTAVLVWEKLPAELAQRIKGGRAGTELDGEMYSDAILEVDENGEVLWRWAIWENLAPDDSKNRLQEFTYRQTWTYVNSLEYVEKNPVNGKPAYLISAANLDSAILVERESGEILWRAGQGLIGVPHSAALSAAGNVLLFDNLTFLRSFGTPYSRIVELEVKPHTEINPAGGMVFEFPPGLPLGKALFFTPINGTVQELPNGNILVSAGITGKIFEVEKKTARVVWDYLSPFGLELDYWPDAITNAVHSAYRYGPEYIPK